MSPNHAVIIRIPEEHWVEVNRISKEEYGITPTSFIRQLIATAITDELKRKQRLEILQYEAAKMMNSTESG